MFLLFFANFLEKQSKVIKRFIRQSKYKKVLKKYCFVDSPKTKKIVIRYNPYERTDFLLIDKLIQSNIINVNDKILDIGCGTGLFLSYLSTKGFKNLSGIEFDKELFDKAVFNSNILQKNNFHSLNLYNVDALTFTNIDDYDCFYFFNTFFDKDTYLEWFSFLKDSLHRNNRLVKLIFLFPTISVLHAVSYCDWIKEKDRVISKSQSCWRCMNFAVYEASL